MGQGLLTRRMGKSRVIAETGAGQHGVATATMAARMGFDCTIYMGALDVARQRPNVLDGTRRHGSRRRRRLTDAQRRDQCGAARLVRVHGHDALCHWQRLWPPSFPQWSPTFNPLSVVKHVRRCAGRGQTATRVYACVGGGSNASGIFAGFLDDSEVELIGVKPVAWGSIRASMPLVLPSMLAAQG